MKKLLFITLAAVLALSVGLVGCSAPTQYTLTIASTTGGSVFPAAGDHSYASGQEVDIKATPASDSYLFVNWTGDVGTIADVSKATTTITMNGDYSITANFQSKPWDSTITLAFHGTISATASVVTLVYKPWIAELKALTGTHGGKFNVTETYGDAPFDSASSLTAISAGTVDIGQLSGDTFHLGSISYLPFHFPSIQSFAYTTYNLFTEDNGKWDKGELSGVKILITSPLWAAQWWGNVDVKVPADLAGVKVRSEGNEGAAILALGGTPVNLGTSDIGASLQTGIVQGCFFTYSGISGFSGIGPNTKYTTELNLYYRAYSLAMCKASYDKLPAEAKAALDSICGAAKSVYYAKQHQAGEAANRAATITGPTVPPPAHPEWGRPIYVPTQAELQLWKAATAGVATKWVSDMTKLGFDGTGILGRAQALIAATPA